MHFVKDNQSIEMTAEIKLGFDQLCPVLFGFQVQIQRASLFTNPKRKSGLTHLSRAN
jgi:hypothetical protein